MSTNTKTKNWSQAQKAFYMLLDRAEAKNKWVFAKDLCSPSTPRKLFIGYEASARLSELAKEFENFIISKNHGRFIARSIDYPALLQVVKKNKLPMEFQQVFDQWMDNF